MVAYRAPITGARMRAWWQHLARVVDSASKLLRPCRPLVGLCDSGGVGGTVTPPPDGDGACGLWSGGAGG